MIKSDKQVNTTDLFNKWVVLRLRNLDPFNKHVGLELTHIIEYSWVDTIQTRHANMNCYPYPKPNITTIQTQPPHHLLIINNTICHHQDQQNHYCTLPLRWWIPYRTIPACTAGIYRFSMCTSTEMQLFHIGLNTGRTNHVSADFGRTDWYRKKPFLKKYIYFFIKIL